MQATKDETADYLVVFDRWRVATDEYHAAVLRLIAGDEVNVASMHAKAIELEAIYSAWVQKTATWVS